MNNDLDSLIRHAAPLSDDEAVRPVSAETRRALLAQITAEPTAEPRRGRRWSLGLPLVAAAGACAVAAGALVLAPWQSEKDTRVVPSPGPGTFAPSPVAALSFIHHKRYIEVKIKDPDADPERYRKEFAAQGMRIDLTMVPASPSVAGHVVMQGGDASIKPIVSKGCYSGGGGDTCISGLRVPIGFKGEAEFAIGRPARPGEKYDSTNSAFTPGEALHCVDIRGLTVDAALPRIQKRHVKATVFNYDSKGPEGYVNVGRDKIPGNWYVLDAEPWAPGEVLLFVQETRPTGKPQNNLLFQNCPRP
ncbi:hypothetical protein [Actinomadura chibensis]|uniref:Uncharacterized protein n=1 Tax=Actinomadura chibensis TaxID=392828 RepID=A0A5D0NQ60_9ACTN|nr:hypothetical protein [Actinomadura chibensis]TYB46278.1 hypothetical protein FXF69_13455 [Actinomadura chibensis]